MDVNMKYAPRREALVPAAGTEFREIADYGSLSVGERISEWALLTPDAPAIEYGRETVCYAELDLRVERLAHWMRHPA